MNNSSESVGAELAARPEHEFTEPENDVLRGFASAAVTWGVLCAIAAIACLALGATGLVGVHRRGTPGVFLVTGVAELSLAIAFIGAGRAFLGAVRTQGRDITHAMRAVRFLSRAFLVQAVVAAGAIVVAIAAGIWGNQ